MNKVADIQFQNDTFILSGELNFSNVMSVYQKSLPDFRKCKDARFDFSKLTSSDSAGLALILEWVKLAKQNKKTISFQNLSRDLELIAKAAGIDGLISLQE